MSKIVRMTLFKLTDATVIKEAIQKYSTLTQDAVKVRSRHLHVRYPITFPASAVQVQPRARLVLDS